MAGLLTLELTMVESMVPIVDGAGTEELQVLLATQLADAARRATFWDRVLTEVMGDTADAGDRGPRARSRGPSGSAALCAHLAAASARLESDPEDRSAVAAAVALHHLVAGAIAGALYTVVLEASAAAGGALAGVARGVEAMGREQTRRAEFAVRFLREGHPRAAADAIAGSVAIAGEVSAELDAQLGPEAGIGRRAEQTLAGYLSATESQTASDGVRPAP